MTNTISTAAHTTIATLIRDTRSRTYRTAKDFWEDHKEHLGASYPHYAAVEASKKFPDINLTIAIAKTLKIELRLACHVWAREQMPTAETKAFFEPVPGAESKGIPTSFRYDLNEFYVFTEKQLPAFKEFPGLWEVLLFIMAFTKSSPPTTNDIALSLQLRLADVERAAEWLRNEGLIYSEDGRLRSRRKFYHLPNIPEFKEVRDQNFKNATNLVLEKISSESLSDKTAYRTTFMRRLTPKQAIEISEKIDELIGHLGNFDELGNDFYALCVGFAPRASLEKGQAKAKKKAKPSK